MSAGRCEKPSCRGLLRATSDTMTGRVTVVCEWCQRKRAGICRDCPAKTSKPRCIRCDRCAEQRNRDLTRQSSARRYADPVQRARKLSRQREHAKQPEVRERRRAYQNEWFASDPGYRAFAQRKYRRTENGRRKTAERNRRWNKENRERRNELNRAYRARNRDVIRAREREKYHAQKRSA